MKYEVCRETLPGVFTKKKDKYLWFKTEKLELAIAYFIKIFDTNYLGIFTLEEDGKVIAQFEKW
jgi:hypothetical protein